MLLFQRIDTKNFYVIKQIFAGFTVGLSLMSVGCWLGWPASFLHDISIEEIVVDLTISQKSWVIILMDIGNSCSPIPTGYMMDLIGRKPTLFITSIIFILSWIFTLISLNPFCLYTARFLAGFGKGMSYTVVPMYLAEISETKYRGGISTLLTQLTYFGICFEVVVSEPTSYLLLNSLSLIVPISCLLLIILIPESPYYLIMKNKQEKAFKAFCWLRKIEAENFENKYTNENIKTEMENMDKQVKYELESRGRWWDLVSSRGTRLATGIVLTTTAMQRLGGMSSALSYTTITLPENERGLTPLQYMMFFAIACMLGSLTCMMLVDKIGRRPLLITSTALCALVQIITAFFYYYHNHPTIDATNFKWTPYICLLVFAFVYVLGIGTIPHTLAGEMFPANVKSKAAALATTILSTSLVVDKIFLHISEEYGVQWMFMIFAITNTIAAIFSYVFVLETKGKSTSEIQQMLQVSNKEQIPDFQLNSI